MFDFNCGKSRFLTLVDYLSLWFIILHTIAANQCYIASYSSALFLGYAGREQRFSGMLEWIKRLLAMVWRKVVDSHSMFHRNVSQGIYLASQKGLHRYQLSNLKRCRDENQRYVRPLTEPLKN